MYLSVAASNHRLPASSAGVIPVLPRRYTGEAPMGIDPHGSLAVVTPGSHRRIAVAGPGVVPELFGVQRPGPAQRVATATVGSTGEKRPSPSRRAVPF